VFFHIFINFNLAEYTTNQLHQMPTSSITYLGGLRTEAIHLQSGTTIITDAPVDNHGRGESFSPTDLVATALGSCMMTIMGIVAERDGIDLKGTTIEINKIMSATAPRRIATIEVVLAMKTAEPLSDADKKKLERVAHTCPVALTLHPDTTQTITFNWL
jgi:putative redox protein